MSFFKMGRSGAKAKERPPPAAPPVQAQRPAGNRQVSQEQQAASEEERQLEIAMRMSVAQSSGTGAPAAGDTRWQQPDDDEEDEDLRRALALSQGNAGASPVRRPQANNAEDEELQRVLALSAAQSKQVTPSARAASHEDEQLQLAMRLSAEHSAASQPPASPPPAGRQVTPPASPPREEPPETLPEIFIWDPDDPYQSAVRHPDTPGGAGPDDPNDWNAGNEASTSVRSSPERAKKTMPVNAAVQAPQSARAATPADASVAALVDVLKRGNRTEHESVARKLGELAASSTTHRAAVISCGGVPLLVDLVRGGWPEAQEQAADALASIATNNADGQTAVAAAGAIQPLIFVVKSGSPGAQAKAACALWRLTVNNAPHKLRIVKAGAIPPLVALLKKGSRAGQVQAAGALGNLAVKNEPISSQIIDAGMAAECPLDAVWKRSIEEPITVHIYDVTGDASLRVVNGLLRKTGTGAFHAGVEVYGREWSFGLSSHDNPTGVYCCHPLRNQAHAYRESVPMGMTWLSEAEVRLLIGRLTKEWPCVSYDLLLHNCCHFCDSLCKELGVGPVPDWVTHLAGAGVALVRGVQKAATSVIDFDEEYRVRATVKEAAGAFAGVVQDMFAEEETVPPQVEPPASEPVNMSPFLNVALEFVRARDVDASLLPVWHKVVARKVEDKPWVVGVAHQPQLFKRLLPGSADRSAIEADHFQLLWEPPTLYLQRLSERPICVEGDLVRDRVKLEPGALIDFYADEAAHEPLLVLRIILGDLSTVMSQLQTTSSLLLQHRARSRPRDAA